MQTSFSSTPRRAGLWLASLTTIVLLAPAASAAVSLTPTVDEPECVVLSGSWSSGTGDYSGEVFDFADDPDIFVRVWAGRQDSMAVGLHDYSVDGFTSGGHAFTSDGSVGAVVPFTVPFSSGRVGEITGVYNPFNDSWSGTYKITEANCDPTHGVPDSGNALTFFVCGIGVVGGLRHVMAKRQRA